MQSLTAARNSRGPNNKMGPKKDHVYAMWVRANQTNAASKKHNATIATKQGILLKYVSLQSDKKSQQKQRHKSRDRSSKKMHNVAEGAAYDSKSEPVYSVQDTTVPPLMYTLKVNGKVIEFEIDTGSGVTIMSRSSTEHLFGQVAYT